MRRMVSVSDEQIKEDYLVNKMTMTEIAKKHNVSLWYISVRIKRFGLKPKTTQKYIGKTFGQLLVLEDIGKDENYHLKFRCQCSCGKEAIVLGYSLLNGNTKSCGCTARKLGKNHGLYRGYEELHGRLFNRLIRGAKDRGLEFKITIQDAWKLFLKQDRKCALTGVPLQFSQRTCSKDQKFTTASLDRIDNSKGYIKGNIQWVHKKIQKLKCAWNQEDLIYWCCLVANYRKN